MRHNMQPEKVLSPLVEKRIETFVKFQTIKFQ
jgi:hypothetical protein